MRVIGIALKTPDPASLLVTAFMSILILGVTTALILSGVATVNIGVAIATGLLGGSLANAYGVSVKDSGCRGAVLSSAFSLALMGLARVLMLIAN